MVRLVHTALPSGVNIVLYWIIFAYYRVPIKVKKLRLMMIRKYSDENLNVKFVFIYNFFEL